MEASLIILLVVGFMALGWAFDWAIVRWILIPAIAAIWNVTLPFWPVMGLFVVVSFLLGFRLRIGKGGD